MSIQEKRAQLREISARAKEIKEALLHNAKTTEEALQIEAMCVNDIIINYIYKDDKNKEFHTFKGWLKEGHAVKKGEKAFLVWGRPKAVQDQEKGKQPDEEGDEDTFFPVSYIFSNAQVQGIKKKKEPAE